MKLLPVDVYARELSNTNDMIRLHEREVAMAQSVDDRIAMAITRRKLVAREKRRLEILKIIGIEPTRPMGWEVA
jgi:GAF domain-containing protein